MSNIPGQFDSSNPEGVITAPKGSRFFRNVDDFYLITNNITEKLNVSKKAFLYKYYGNNPSLSVLKDEFITFAKPSETWIKIGKGNNSTGWALIGNYNSFARFVSESSPIIMGDIAGVWASNDTSYVLKTNGDLWSMGENYDGELGTGTAEYRETASVSLTNVKLAAGSCEGDVGGAVKNDGTLWFTGYGNGQFGNGTGDSYDVWTETILEGDITGSGTISNLSVGDGFTALLMSDGTVWMSSTNNYFGFTSNVFLQVESNVKSISAGGYHFMYIKNDDTLWGFGYNDDGELGTGNYTYLNWDEPAQIDTNVKFVAAMGYHTAYIKNDDTLWMMGANWDGQLGTGDDNNRTTPVQIDTNVKFVNGGDSHTLYIKNDGSMYGMGYNGNGELGDGQFEDLFTPTLIDTDVSSVVCGGSHTLYIKTDKTLYGMGYNYYYQLGNIVYPTALYSTSATSGWTKEGVTQFKYNDTDVLNELYWKDAIYADGKFIAGGGEGLARLIYSTDGKTWNTGSIEDLGAGIQGIAYNGTNKYVAVSSVSDLTNAGLPEVYTSTDGINWITGSLNNTGYYELKTVRYLNDTFIAGGQSRIVTSADGDTWDEQTGAFDASITDFAYGAGKYVASVAYGSYTNSNRNVFLQTFDNRTASFASCGEGHAMLLQNGTLYGCGYNSDGQVGIGSNLTGLLGFVPVASNVRNVACGQYYTTFVKNDSTLWGMGANYYGQLGDGTYMQRNSPVQIDTNVSQSCGGSTAYYATAYIKNDNTLWGMGYNAYGQLGSGSFESYVSQSVYVDDNVVHASVGGAYMVYIKSDGTLWGIGYNGNGQLGLGDNTNRSASVQITSSVAYCAAGSNFSYFITTGGDLYSMGYNGNGQLGIGNNTAQNTPTFVTSSVVMVSANQNSGMFVTSDGSVYGMGYNSDGHFGDGTNSTSNVPTLCANSGSMVSAGVNFTYLIKTDGAVYSCGYDWDGKLGTYLKVNKGMYSTNSIDWHTSSMTNVYYNGIAYGNGRFVAAGEDYNVMASSTDGVNWTSSFVTTSSYALGYKIIFDGTKFVASSQYGDYGYNVFTSTNGVDWTMSKTGDSQHWGPIAYGDGKYILLTSYRDDYINPKYKLTIE
jgi:alpha-tubulin suppressor-like RCC1 family protein